MATMPCEGCGTELTHRDKFCPDCGVEVPEEMHQELRARFREERLSGRGRVSRAAASRARSLQRASFWIMVLAILYALGGALILATTKPDIDRQLEMLAIHGEETPIIVEGEVTTVGERRAQLEKLLALILVTQFVLAGIFFVCFFVTKKKPVIGTVTAFAVFVVVNVVSAVVDPVTIFMGIIIKVLAIFALAGGMKAAFAQVAADRGEPSRYSRARRRRR